MEQLAKLDLAIQPMLHVESMGDSLTFFERLGAQVLFGSRDGDYALVQFGATKMGLLAHPPSPDNPEPLELHFESATPLEQIEEHLQATAPEMIHRGTGDEAFGKMLKLRTPDGLVVKLLELERDLIE